MTAGISAVSQKAAATCRNKSVVHSPPAKIATITAIPTGTASLHNGCPFQSYSQAAQHPLHTAASITSAAARAATLTRQMRRRSSGWASSIGNVFNPNSRPNVDSASSNAPSHMGYRAPAIWGL